MTRLFIEASRVDKSSRQLQRDMSYAAIRSIAEAKPAPAAARLPNDLPAFMQQQIDDIRLIQERYAWFLDGVFADAVFEKKKGQKKIPLAPMICSRGYEAFISGVSLGESPETDAPPVKTQYRIRGEKEKAEIVEKMYFDRLLDFVYVEFMKGLQKGFVPKRCANCGRWFRNPGRPTPIAPELHRDRTARPAVRSARAAASEARWKTMMSGRFISGRTKNILPVSEAD